MLHSCSFLTHYYSLLANFFGSGIAFPFTCISRLSSFRSSPSYLVCTIVFAAASLFSSIPDSLLFVPYRPLLLHAPAITLFLILYYVHPQHTLFYHRKNARYCYRKKFLRPVLPGRQESCHLDPQKKQTSCSLQRRKPGATAGDSFSPLKNYAGARISSEPKPTDAEALYIKEKNNV